MAACLGKNPTQLYAAHNAKFLRDYLAAVILNGGMKSELSLPVEPSAPRVTMESANYSFKAPDLASACHKATADLEYVEEADRVF